MIRFYNAQILKRNQDGRYYTESGEIVTDGARILHVGAPISFSDRSSRLPAPDSQPSRDIDCHGNLLIPGFKNCHTHSAMTLLRGAGEGLPLKRWLYERIFPLESRMMPEDVYFAAHLAIAEYLAGGTTAAQDMYFYADETARAVTEAGFRCVGVGASADSDGKTEESLRRQEELLKKYTAGGAFSFRVGFHAEYTASDALLKGVKILSERFQSPVHFHLSETEAEVRECLARTGKTPPERIASFGLFGRGGAAYHCVHLRDGDLKYFSHEGACIGECGRQASDRFGRVGESTNDYENGGMYIVSNPRSNLKLGSGSAPLKKYLEKGLRVALGTDGAASNNRLSMFDELNTAVLLSKVNDGGIGIGADAALDAAFYDGAFAMGTPDARALEVGMRADIVLLDIDRPNMRPQTNSVDRLVYSASDSNVLLTMVGGRILYENGEYATGVDYERVKREFEARVRRLSETEN